MRRDQGPDTGNQRDGRSGEEALAAGLEALKGGLLEGALRDFDEALAWATARGDQRLRDRAFCNRSGVELELGRIHQPLGELRRILLRSPDPENCFLAAYNISRSYELAKDHQRALFYARVARDRCLKLERADWLAWSLNQTGNLLLATSSFDEACRDYELALKLMPFAPSVERAFILDNLGYCLVVQGRYREGFGHLYESLRTLRRFGAWRYEPLPRLSLCFAYLDVGKYDHALRHAEISLGLAESYGDVASIKNALYLLGETHNQLGETEPARRYFTRLQQSYYPEAVHVPEFLLAIDVRRLINLKA